LTNLSENSKNTVQFIQTNLCRRVSGHARFALRNYILRLVKAGNNGNTSLFLVGDTDQAIYASLGGVAKEHRMISKPS
jgi:superfamily I DNA/RNA helicase